MARGRSARGRGGAAVANARAAAEPAQGTDDVAGDARDERTDAAQAGARGGEADADQALQDTRSTPATATGTSKDDDASCCGMCEAVVGDTAIGCDRCNDWFCPTEMCMGLPENAIALISSLRDENSVLFVCTGCRVNPGPGAWMETRSARKRQGGGESMKQLFVTVKGLASEMAKLTVKLDSAISQGTLSAAKVTAQPLSQSGPERQTPAISTQDYPPLPSGRNRDADLSYRKAIRQEVVEVREREKRRFSVVIKGLSAREPDAIASEFSKLTSKVMGCEVTLSDIMKIKDHPDLCRAKIMNDEHRSLVLDKAKTLKDSEFDHIYIRRDLTYTQRQELKMKREKSSSHAPPVSGPQLQTSAQAESSQDDARRE